MLMQIIEVYTEHLAKRKLPTNFSESDSALFSHELIKKIPSAAIYILRDVDVLNDEIFDKRSLQFFSRHTKLYRPTKWQRIKRLLLYFFPMARLDKAVWIIDDWSCGYFHWITDALPRLVATEGYLKNHRVLLPEEYRSITFIGQSLDMLKRKYAYYNRRKGIRVAEMLLPSHTSKIGNYNRNLISILRSKFLAKEGERASRKIFISRQKSDKRKITNENEVQVMLQDLGYEIHFFEQYSFGEQLLVMRQTSHLIGIHGAGLTNMLFMPESAKVLELRNEGDALNNCYFTLASDIGHDYYYCLCHGDSKDTHSVNLTVDLDKLKRIVSIMHE